MIKHTLFFILLSSSTFDYNSNQSKSKHFVNQDHEWRIGGKIHFEEESGEDYIGIKEINNITRTSLKKFINIDRDTCSENAKILVKKEANEILVKHFEEKSRPGKGEEMHATLLYTQPRGFCDSETLKQVSKNIFEKCDFPPTIESVSLKYSSIIKSDWKFEISEVVLTKGVNDTSFIMLKLLFDGNERLYNADNPISADLHMTLINFDNSIRKVNLDASLLLKELNQALKGKKIKIAQKNGIADLEFGISGSSWRIRAAERWE